MSLRAAMVLAFLLGAFAPTAHADKAIARERFRTATQHYDLAEFKDALADYKEAYRNFEDPSFLFNIAQCLRQLGDKEQAIRFFRTYLGKAPDAPNRNEVRDMIGRLEAALQQERAAKTSPPQGTINPEGSSQEPKLGATTAPSVAPADTSRSAAPALTAQPVKLATPVYKKWWLWTVVGVVAVGVGVGLGVGLTRTPAAPSAPTQDGTFHPF